MSVHPTVLRSFVGYQSTHFQNEWTDSDANWQTWSTGEAHVNLNFGGQEVTGQGHRRPKLDLEAWQKHCSPPRWIEWLFSFTYSNETAYVTWNELQRSFWRSPAMSSYPRRLDFLLRDRKSRTQLIFRQNSLNDLEGQSRSLAMAQFNSPHITFY